MLTLERCFLDEVLPRLLAIKDGSTVVEPADLAARKHHIGGSVAMRHW